MEQGTGGSGSGTNGSGSPKLPKGTVENVTDGGKMAKPKSSSPTNGSSGGGSTSKGSGY